MFIKTKSPETYFLINTKIEMLLTEQRHQRADLATIKRQLHTIISDAGIQKQVDSYFEDTEHIPEVNDGNSTSN